MIEYFKILKEYYPEKAKLDCPIKLISAKLKKDILDNEILLQINMVSVCNDRINAVFVEIESFDAANDPIEINGKGKIPYVYMDLDIIQGEKFGHCDAIKLPLETRKFKVNILKIVLSGDKVWKNTEGSEVQIKNQIEFIQLEEKIRSILLHKIASYNNGKYFATARFLYSVNNDCWQCICGNPNSIEDVKCLACGIERDFVSNEITKEAAEAEQIILVEAEKKEAELLVQKETEWLDNVEKGTKAKEDRKKITEAKLKTIESQNKEKMNLVEKERDEYVKSVVQDKKWKFKIYRVAKEISDSRPDLAISLFKYLDDFKDSNDQIPMLQHELANKLLDEKKYVEAIYELEKLDRFSRNIKDLIETARYNYYKSLLEQQNVDVAIAGLFEIIDSVDAKDLVYNQALNFNAAKQFDEAIEIFKKLNSYKDSKQIVATIEYEEVQRLIESGLLYQAALKLIQMGNDKDNYERSYNIALELCKKNHVEKSIEILTKLNDYRDSKKQLALLLYDNAKKLAEQGKPLEAMAAFMRIYDYKDAYDQYSMLSKQNRIVAGMEFIAALNENGTVNAIGSNSDGECNCADWTQIVSLSAGRGHVIGIRRDGKAIATGFNGQGECNVANWANLVSVSGGWQYTIGLKADGTVVATGRNEGFFGGITGQCNTSSWAGIVAISAGFEHSVGLKKNGTVLATGNNNNVTNDYKTGQCNVTSWTDIVAIAAGEEHTVGLKKDGTVIATRYLGNNYSRQCDVSNWTDIVAISADTHTVGLKKDGTVVAVGSNKSKECNVQSWSDIVAISACSDVTLGLKKDGTVICTDKKYDTSNWKLW